MDTTSNTLTVWLLIKNGDLDPNWYPGETFYDDPNGAEANAAENRKQPHVEDVRVQHANDLKPEYDPKPE